MAIELPKIGPADDPKEYSESGHGHDYVPIEEPDINITAVHNFMPVRHQDNPPFRTNSRVLVSNLNSDLLDGQHADEFVEADVFDLLVIRVEVLEGELSKLIETNELLRRILAEVTKQRIALGEATDTHLTDEDVKEVWQ